MSEETKVQHTPGPWKASPYSSIVGCAVTAQPDPRANTVLVAAVRSGQANARLIAAAPKMLAALKAVVGVADRDTVEFARARAVIAQAEGREP